MIKHHLGQSLVEVLIALTIFALTISAVLLVFFGGQYLAQGSLASHQALEKAHSGMEGIRAIRTSNWTSLTDGIHGLAVASGSWTLTGTPDVSDGFTRTVSISTDYDGIKHIETTVSWDRPPQGVQTVTLYQTVAPLEEGIYGDWSRPCILSAADGSPGAKGTDVYYFDGRAYVTSSESAVNKPDFYVFDVLDPRNPTRMSELNTGPGLKAVSVRETYAYAVEEGAPEFLIIDVSNPSAPVLKTKTNFPGGAGRSVVTRHTYAYVTTVENAGGHEFFVFDITDPMAPVVVASLEMGAAINELSIMGDIAYLATSSDSKELTLVDISDPLNPFEISGGVYDLPGTSDATAIHAKAGRRVYMSTAVATGVNELYILDVTNPTSITLRGSKDTAGTINSLYTAGTLTFAGTDLPNQEFENYYIRNPLNIEFYAGLNFSNIATGTSYNNNIVYFSLRNTDILQLVTSEINGICGG